MGPSVEGVLLVCSNGSVPLNKMAAMPIYGKKNFKILFFFRTKKALRLRSTKFVQMTFDLLQQGQICITIHLYGEIIEKSFSQKSIKD